MLALVLGVSDAARAQRPKPPPREPELPPPTAVMIDERATALEADLGGLMQRRVGESAGGPPPELELRIDVRIVARWLLAVAAQAPAESNVQVCAWIRAGDVMSAALLVEQELDAGRRSAGANTTPARALRDLTFKLGDGKDVNDARPLDAACRTAAGALLATLGGDGGTAGLPPMRPPDYAGPATAAAGAEGPRTVDQLAARAGSLAVSIPLRAQLLAFAKTAREAANDPKRAKEAAEVRAVFEEAVTLAEGLGSNTAVERADRDQMESQVAQGLALYLDARTRPLGQRRIAAMGQYRKLLSGLREMDLSPELLRRFGPAITWARREPEQGAKLMDAIGLFLRQDVRLASTPPGANELAGPYAKVAEELKRRAAKGREVFVEAAGSAVQFRNPDSLRRLADGIRLSLDAREAVARTPAALKSINAYRPKPFGAIEKRVQTTLNAFNADASDADVEAATRFLAKVDRLGVFADEAARPATPTAPADDAAARAYTGGAADAFRTRRKALVGEIVNRTASGQPLDDAMLAPLETARSLLEAVATAADAERAVVHADALRRWVDWGVDRESLDALLAPYRDATAAAFKGFIDEDVGPVKRWAEQRRRYDAVLGLLARVGGQAGACDALPAGRTGALAKLATPLADAPFAVERSSRLALDTWSHHRAAGNAAAADKTLETLAKRLPR